MRDLNIKNYDIVDELEDIFNLLEKLKCDNKDYIISKVYTLVRVLLFTLKNWKHLSEHEIKNPLEKKIPKKILN